MSAADGLAPILDANLHGPDVPDPLEPARDITLDLQAMGREQISELAEIMSGQSRKGQPRGYLSARRQLERWRRGGVNPTLKSRERLRSARRRESDRIKTINRRGADMRMRIRWGSAGIFRKPEMVPARQWLHIPAQIMRRVTRLWSEGETEKAAEALLAQFLKGYNVPNPGDWARDILIEQLELEPARPGAPESWQL